MTDKWIILILVLELFSCNSNQKPSTKLNQEEDKPLLKDKPLLVDKLFIVDYINSYPEDDIYFASAIYNKNIVEDNVVQILEDDTRNNLIKSYDEFSHRYKISKQLAIDYFNHYDTIFIYNIHSDLIGQGIYNGHENYEEAISSQFVSTYKISFNSNVNEPLRQPFYYSNLKNNDQNKVRWVEKPILKKEILDMIVQNNYLGSIDQTEIKTFQYVYNNEEYTFYSNGNINVFLKENDRPSSVYFSENAMIFDVNATQFAKNGKPVFLLKCGQPETDYFYDLTLIWDGKRYIVSR